MIITKEHQEAMVGNYAKKGNNFDKCEAFTDGLNAMWDYFVRKEDAVSIEWEEAEERMKIIGQNGNSGEHYKK